MKIKWIKHKDGAAQKNDITTAVQSVTWSGSVSQAARTAEVAVIHAPDDKNVNVLKLNIGAGDVIKLYEGADLLFFGEVQSTRKTGETGTVTYTCFDLLNHLLRSTGAYRFANTTAEAVTRKVCADLKIKTGSIAETKATIRKMIIESDTFYDIIMKAYTKAARQTQKKYICRMEGNKLSVKEKGTIVKNFVLQEGYNITSAEYEETIENMINVVKIYNEKGAQVGEVKNDKHVSKFGIYQQIYKKEKGINEKNAAKSLLQGIEKRVTVGGINGDIACIAGNGVEVYDKAAGLSGLFWIDSDTHTWEDGVHTMSLDLNFKNIMDKKQHTETEKTKKEKKSESI